MFLPLPLKARTSGKEHRHDLFFGNHSTLGDPTLRFSGSPTQLTKEARSSRVRCKRLFGGGH